MKKTTKLLIAAFLLMFVINSCKKEKDETATPNNSTSQTGRLLLHLHTYVDINEVDAYNIAYTMETGRSLSLSLAQFYISDIQIEKLDGTLYAIPNQNILKILDVETYMIGDVPVGNYKSIRFKVGLSSTTNAQSPTVTGDSVILNRSDMWFAGAAQPSGYVFFNAQGSIDTSADMSGKMCPFVYKIGTNANYKQVIMPNQNHTVLPQQVEYMHMYVDYGKLFNGITLDNAHLSINTTAENNSVLANQLINNIPSMFKYE